MLKKCKNWQPLGMNMHFTIFYTTIHPYAISLGSFLYLLQIIPDYFYIRVLLTLYFPVGPLCYENKSQLPSRKKNSKHNITKVKENGQPWGWLLSASWHMAMCCLPFSLCWTDSSETISWNKSRSPMFFLPDVSSSNVKTNKPTQKGQVYWE